MGKWPAVQSGVHSPDETIWFSSHFGGYELLWKVESMEIGSLCFQSLNGNWSQNANGKKNPMNILGLGFNTVLATSGVAHPGCTCSRQVCSRDLGIVIFLMPFGSSLKVSTTWPAFYQINKSKNKVHEENYKGCI